MSVLVEISEFVQKGRAKNVKELVSKALENGVTAKKILNEGLIAGMMAIGERFKKNEVYVPEVLIAARAMNMGVAILKPYLTQEGVEPVGKAIICTVKGDLHDIGKNLVKMMLEGVGIECIDLGTDVSAETVVNAVKENEVQVVALSSLLTTTMEYHKDIIEALNAAGLRNSVKVMIGGAPVSEEFARQVGADVYTDDAATAADVALSFFK
ncbi:MAG: corrinoid protein [Clostridia bacterium]|nr:corrinoid protein [Clostridia bacterium]